MKIIKEFKQFLLRGNVVDLAVGVVIGAAFGAVVTALVADFLTPLIGAIIKTPDFAKLFFTVNGSQFLYGHFLNTLISFILVALSVFLFVIKPMNYLIEKTQKSGKPSEPSMKSCPECLGEVPKAATRCMHCGQRIAE